MVEKYLLTEEKANVGALFLIAGGGGGGASGQNTGQGYVNLVHWDERPRSEEHTSELQSLMRISYAVFCLKKKKQGDVICETTRQHSDSHNIRKSSRDTQPHQEHTTSTQKET